ncbi:hypothetical protein K438DRAFT_774206 [Mycena galopus ATCC 62051]|nr:hypothetical protein K438DRAFT_774206 [Mycena galopus ATCC 62051]
MYYFSSDGVQKNEPPTVDALRSSWVLIDTDGGDWDPPQMFDRARCVVCTSSPRDSCMNNFLKRFGAETWYMKAWSSKEITAVTCVSVLCKTIHAELAKQRDRLAIDRAKVLERLDAGGPVARSLWGGAPVPSPQTIDTAIHHALSRDNIFAFSPTEPSPIFLIQPLVVIDAESGRACLQRTDYSAEFISAHMARRTVDLAAQGGHLERIQGQLTAALDLFITRAVAGTLLEGMMHRALTRGMQLPAVFGAGTVAGTLAFIGKAESFVCEPATTDIAKERPLYLRPGSLDFAAVDALLVTHEKLGLIQASSLGHSHRRDFGMMLRIMSRLARGAQVDVSGIGEVIYCLVGTAPEHVQQLLAEASETLAELKTFDAQELSRELGVRHTARLSRFRVVGYTFDYKQGFTEVQ